LNSIQLSQNIDVISYVISQSVLEMKYHADIRHASLQIEIFFKSLINSIHNN